MVVSELVQDPVNNIYAGKLVELKSNSTSENIFPQCETPTNDLVMITWGNDDFVNQTIFVPRSNIKRQH